MAQLPAQTPSETGAALTYSPAANGDSFANTGAEILHVKNAAGSAITVTVPSRNTAPEVPGYGPVAKPDRQVIVPAGSDRLIGPFPTKAFNNPATSRVSLTFSSTPSVSVAVIAPRTAS
ncbi:hypothetical protein GBZ48_31490 [Azospirillum melinis]|uniref:Uncharacterized protein n=1 Tax=Azospirillum melinis TaxID=328839 RepID=A0ABX2KLY3_9PROT|nr:hypothetical protein [Azospirillum melinis]MBP2310499.1 hypothetical protein [Azospirillum melinis]NUB03741.1 hypothetical protein [Azospirillum melinis]